MTTPELPGSGSKQPPPNQQQQPPADQSAYAAPAATLPPTQAKKPLNVLGLVALIAAVLGFIFACIPGALIIGWILLPIAFVLAIISLFLKDKPKWMGLTALIVSVVGTIVGAVVFVSVVATSFDDAFGNGDTTVVESPGDASVDDEAAEEGAVAESGTRENPYPIGSVIESDDWSVVINSVTLAATDAVMAANEFNAAPAAGSEYILVNYSTTYTGDDPDGRTPIFVSIEYVTADGATVSALDSVVLPPDPIDSTSTLYTDGTATGNAAMEVPTATAGQGVLAVQPGVVADKVFVAVQ